MQVSGFLGRLVSNPQLWFKAYGQAMLRFMLATEPEKRAGAAGGQESVWRFTAWHALAVKVVASR